MKKLSFFLLFLLALSSHSQNQNISDSLKIVPKDTSWKTPGLLTLNLSQTQLSNWQAGGENNLSIISIFKFDPRYKKKLLEWNGKVNLQYGIIKTGDSRIYQKNTDQIFLLSNFDIKNRSKYWFLNTQADFRSQFAPGYNYVADTTAGPATSDFMSPAYIQLAFGVNFKIKNYFSAAFSPLAAKITVVDRQYLADRGEFGVEPAKRDSAGKIIIPGKKGRFEFGGRIVIKFKKEILKNVELDSYVDLFSNYANHPENIDVIVNNTLNFKINKYFTATVISQLLYDDDVIVKKDWDKDGLYDKPEDINGPRLQSLTTIAVGFGFKF